MKRRILMAMVGVASVAVIALAVPLGLAVRHLYEANQVIALQRQATLAGLQIPAGFASSPDQVELPPTKPGWGIALYGTDGHMVTGTGPAIGDAVVRAALHGQSAGSSANGRTVVAVPLATKETVFAAMRASAPESAVLSQAERAWAALAALAVVAVLIAGILARGLAARIAGPLHRLATAAHDLGTGNFTIEMAPSGISEVDAVGAVLADTATRLGGVLERERAFSADASHQLLTPIAALRLTLERGVDDPGVDYQTALVEGLTQLDRLESTVDGLLELRRDVTAGTHEIDPSVLLNWARAQWHARLAMAGRPFRITSGPDLLRACVSFEAARHVLDVLIDNALQHGRGAVEVRMRNHGGTLVVSVSDEGPGLAGDPKEPFRRHVKPGPGHGIGLALARSLVEADGGRLELTNPGPRPVFTIVWPASTEGKSP